LRVGIANEKINDYLIN